MIHRQIVLINYRQFSDSDAVALEALCDYALYKSTFYLLTYFYLLELVDNTYTIIDESWLFIVQVGQL